MNNDPLVSIFVPAFNAEKTIKQAIDSVLAQTYQNYELLILNDASTDRTPDIIEKYKNHPRLSIYHNPQNLGMAHNSNKGIRLCQGAFIIRLDADDFYAPDYLQKVLAVFAHPSSPEMVFTGAQLVFPNGETRSELPYQTSWIETGQTILPQILRYCPMRAPSVCVKRSCYDKLGGVLEELKIHIDWEMWVRVAANCRHIGYVAEPLTYYRILNPTGCTSASIIDAISPIDCGIWLEYLDKNKLPYQLTDNQLHLLKLGMYELTMAFAAFALDAGYEDSVQKHLAFARTLLPPGSNTTSMQARLYARAAEVFLMEEGQRKKGWRYLLKSMRYSFPPVELGRFVKLWTRALLGNSMFNFVREKTVARKNFSIGANT